MPNLFDYLAWRGDLSVEQEGLCPVDGLVFSALAYVPFAAILPSGLEGAVTVAEACAAFLARRPAGAGRRRPEERRLLEALMASRRFSSMGLAFHTDRLEEEMQFSALTVLPGSGEAFLAFRGTDDTLVGWKEDFSMSFLDAVPAQRAAAGYVRALACRFPGPLILGGHSKGGNLAVFGAAMAPAAVRDRVKAVYNFDGPGFTGYLLSQGGYAELLTRIHTFLPQCSVVGMLLDREEECTLVKSAQVGLLQHDLYSWQVEGGTFVPVEELTAGSRLVGRTVKGVLARLSPQDRERAVDALFDALAPGETAPREEVPTLSAALGRLVRKVGGG